MSGEYLVELSAQERRVIKNLMLEKIEHFEAEIEDHKSDIMYVSDRKEWIKNYRALIRKLDAAGKKGIQNEN